MIFNMVGGGGSLNFKVTAYASEAALLAATATANTIGVITTTAITSYVFSSDEPSSPTDGMVWVTTGTSSSIEFNALKNNCLQVYPIRAKQYISGAWVDVSCMSYQGGSWTKWWSGELYDAGNEYDDYTGGFISAEIGYTTSTASYTILPTITRNANNLEISIADGLSASSAGGVYLKNKVDLTSYDALNFQGVMHAGQSSYAALQVRICVWSDLPTYVDDYLVASATGETSSGKVVDISSLSGEYYIGFWMYNYQSYITVNKLWLE